MNTERKLRISQCMIVKNEEKNIERALSWGKDIVYEQIVVDTGSTDHTVEIARQMGARVYSFPWKDDFASAKNYAIEQAQGEWIAFLDADEYMVQEDVIKVWDILSNLKPGKFDGISTGWQQLDEGGRIFSSGTQVRFFRNLPDIRYYRRIHEQLISISGRELSIGDAVNILSVFHTGYQGSEYKEKKGCRNRRLILAELEISGENAEMLGYMGDEYFSDGERDEAERWYRRSIVYMPSVIRENDQRSAVTYTRLLIILTERENTDQDEIERIYSEACSRITWEADFDYVLGRYYASHGQADKARFCLETAIGKMERFGCSNKALLLAANLTDAYDLLARCCYKSEDRENCVTYAAICLKQDKYTLSALLCLLMLLTAENVWIKNKEKDKNQIFEFFSGLYDFSSLKDKLFLVKAAEKVECYGFMKYIENRLLSLQEREVIRKVQDI